MKKQKSTEEKALKDVNAYLKKFTQPLLPVWQFKEPLAVPYFPRHGNIADQAGLFFPALYARARESEANNADIIRGENMPEATEED